MELEEGCDLDCIVIKNDRQTVLASLGIAILAAGLMTELHPQERLTALTLLEMALANL
jgi:hypothetical protein